MSSNTATQNPTVAEINVIEPQEMGTDFVFNQQSGKWQLAEKFNDVVTDDTMIKYQLVSVPAEHKVKLYEYTGASFDIATAIPKGEADISVLEHNTDDTAIEGTVITFTDSESGKTISFDTASPIFNILKANSKAIKLTGDGKNGALTATLIIDSNTDNLAKITANGLVVDKNDVLALINAKGEGLKSLQFKHDSTAKNLQVTVNEMQASIATTPIKNTGGKILGYAISTNQATNTQPPPPTSEYQLVWADNGNSEEKVKNITNEIYLDTTTMWDIYDKNGTSVFNSDINSNDFKITFEKISGTSTDKLLIDKNNITQDNFTIIRDKTTNYLNIYCADLEIISAITFRIIIESTNPAIQNKLIYKFIKE